MKRHALVLGVGVLLCGCVAARAQDVARRGAEVTPVAAAGGEWGRRDLAGMRQDTPRDMPFMRMLENPRLAEELKLTEEQTSALKDAQAGIKDKALALRRQIEESAMKQARLMTADPLDENALLAAVEETGRIHTDIAKLNIQALVVLKRVLTPEQIATARELVRRRMDLRRNAEGDAKMRRDGRKRDLEGGGKDPKAQPQPNPEPELR